MMLSSLKDVFLATEADRRPAWVVEPDTECFWKADMRTVATELGKLPEIAVQIDDRSDRESNTYLTIRLSHRLSGSRIARRPMVLEYMDGGGGMSPHRVECRGILNTRSDGYYKYDIDSRMEAVKRLTEWLARISLSPESKARVMELIENMDKAYLDDQSVRTVLARKAEPALA